MKRTNRCPKCESTNVIADAKARDCAHMNAVTELSVAVYRKPQALLFKGETTSTLSAWVCGDCGYVEFYADKPERLKKATAESRGQLFAD